MSQKDLLPTEEEVGKYMLSMLQHSCNVEYFLNTFGLQSNDPERPHDLVGVGNKFEWDVIKGLALQYRTPKVDFDKYILPSLKIHRQQYHHKKWNGVGNSRVLTLGPNASIVDMIVGAIDATCSHREDRSYQGGILTYDEIENISRNRGSAWMLEVIPEMRRIKQPSLELISSLSDFPNIGVGDEIYERTRTRTNEAVSELREINYKLNDFSSRV